MRSTPACGAGLARPGWTTSRGKPSRSRSRTARAARSCLPPATTRT
uniref:Uncharacterized protein n=1 Tax=Human herpesvirus 2 TaxID=10310 RepID=A0A481TBR8_HHV2|nr:hypothetical protein [Human alphaherpesvirus 2]